MTSMPHLEVLEWDYADRLQHTLRSNGSNQHTYFTYDGNGQRVRKVYVHSGIADERIYLGGVELFRRRGVNGSGTLGTVTLERETLHVMDDTRRVAMAETLTVDTGGSEPIAVGQTRWRYQLDDHLGSSAMELDDAAQVISYEEYHPYGSTAFHLFSGSAEVSLRRYRYTGKEKDDETGLYYHGARYYAPWLGRWTAADPNELAGPNRYRYVSNNPILMWDPNGEEEEEGGFWSGFGGVVRKAAGDFADGAVGAAKGVNNYLQKTGEGLGDLAYGIVHDDTQAKIAGAEALIESLETISIQNQLSVAEDVVVGTVQALASATVGIGTESVEIYEAVESGDSKAAGEHTARLLGDVVEVGLAVLPAAKATKTLGRGRSGKAPAGTRNGPKGPDGPDGPKVTESMGGEFEGPLRMKEQPFKPKDAPPQTTQLSRDVLEYARDIEARTGTAVHASQRSRLADALRETRFERLPKEQARAHRARFNKVKDELIAEWEAETGATWPRYSEDLYNAEGTLLRKAGQPYDAHHIIESSYGGPNEWWNIHPARFPDQHQGGIHRSGGPAGRIFR